MDPSQCTRRTSVPAQGRSGSRIRWYRRQGFGTGPAGHSGQVWCTTRGPGKLSSGTYPMSWWKKDANVSNVEDNVNISNKTCVYRSGGGRVVKLSSCGARGPEFDSRHRHLNFQRLVISCFQVAIWLKYRQSDVNPQYNQPTNNRGASPTSWPRPTPRGRWCQWSVSNPKMNLQSKFGYCMTTQTLFVRGQTDKQTYGWMDDLITRCPGEPFRPGA